MRENTALAKLLRTLSKMSTMSSALVEMGEGRCWVSADGYSTESSADHMGIARNRS
jgi:hypothetical protein